MTKADHLARIMDDASHRGIRDGLWNDVANDASSDCLRLYTDNEHEPLSAIEAYLLWAWISDLYEDPRLPYSMDDCIRVWSALRGGMVSDCRPRGRTCPTSLL